MVDVIKAPFNIALNKPFGTDKLMFHLRKCRMATSARAKAVGIV